MVLDEGVCMLYVCMRGVEALNMDAVYVWWSMLETGGPAVFANR